MVMSHVIVREVLLHGLPLSKAEDRRYDLMRYRVRYRIYFPDGSWSA
jgi:hypothetical protein